MKHGHSDFIIEQWFCKHEHKAPRRSMPESKEERKRKETNVVGFNKYLQ